MKTSEFIAKVAQANRVTQKMAKRHLLDTIVKGSYGYVLNDVKWIINEALYAGLLKSDALLFFEENILPQMNLSYQAKYRMARLSNQI